MQIINLDLSVKMEVPSLQAKQGDVGRKFQAVITDGGTAYNIPSGTTLSVWYSSTSGEGNYSEIGLDDDFLRSRSAFTISGNTVTVELVAQMLSCPGGGIMCLVMNNAEGEQVATWNIPYYVEKIPGANSEGAKQYYTAYAQAAMREMSSALVHALEDAKQSGEFDGPRGIQGERGDDGKTPVKGTDYWTEADKQEIVDDIVEAVILPAMPQMYGAVGDGVSDDTKAINDCLANNKRVYIPEGTYVVDPAVSLIMQNDQILEMSENAIIKTSITDESKYNYAIAIKNVENVTVRGGKICGDKLAHPDSTLERGYGIYIYNSKNVNIERCEISDFRGDCIIIESIKGDSDVYGDIVNRNIKISDCKIHNALRHGITVMGVYGLAVKDTEIFNTQGKTYSSAIDAEVHYEWQKMEDFRCENVRAYDCKIGILFNHSNLNGAIKNVSISRCDFTRAQFDMDGDVDIDWSDIRSISVGHLDSFTISHSNLTLLYIRANAKKVTANKCVFECTESNPQALSFEWASDESTVECEFNDCVFKSYTSNVRDVSAEKRLFNVQLNPVTFMLNGCTIYVNNPNGVGVGARKWAKVFGCRFIYKFNAEGYTDIFLSSNAAKSYVVGNVFDTMEVEAKYYDQPIIASNMGDLFFTNNIGVMTKMVGSYLTYVSGEGAGRTCSIINNVFTSYWGKGYNNTNVTYVHIGNVYAGTTE